MCCCCVHWICGKADHHHGFGQANIDHMQELASSMAVASLPYFVLYKGAGDPLSKFTASLQPNRLAKLRAEIALRKA